MLIVVRILFLILLDKFIVTMIIMVPAQYVVSLLRFPICQLVHNVVQNLVYKYKHVKLIKVNTVQNFISSLMIFLKNLKIQIESNTDMRAINLHLNLSSGTIIQLNQNMVYRHQYNFRNLRKNLKLHVIKNTVQIGLCSRIV